MKLILLSLMVIAMPLVSAELSEKQICDKVFYFLVETSNDYSDSQKEQFKASLEINDTQLNEYLMNYTNKCFNLTNKSLPFSLQELETLDINKTTKECVYKIGKKVLFMDSDMSIPTPRVYLPEMDCYESKKWRWIWKLGRNDSTFYMSGVKLYVILLPLILFVSLWFIKQNREINLITERYINKER